MTMKHLKLFIFSIAAVFLSATSASAAVYRLHHGDDVVGKSFVITAQKGDSITKYMMKYELSYHELTEANPHIRFTRLKEGNKIIIPTQFILPPYRDGIVVNIPELRLYYFPQEGGYVFTTPVALGREGWRTPSMETFVARKQKDPTWFVPDSIKEESLRKGQKSPDFIPPGPDNPLGAYALYLNRNGYLLHGTSNPSSVGKFASHGCMRLNAQAIDFLYHNVPVKTKVRIINHATKAGYLDDDFYVEIHRPLYYANPNKKLHKNDIKDAVNRKADENTYVDWDKVHQLNRQKTGIPVPVGSR